MIPQASKITPKAQKVTAQTMIINKKQLETDGELFASLRERSAKMVGDETIVSVRIHSTDFNNNYGYLIANTSEIQQEI